ncbi:Uncharacterised protein g6932 [Pycnogonum litorale]
MSANSIRGIRRKKSSLSEVKVAVLGAPGVGKSALIVRFLTKRYIGEYDHQTENIYKSEILVDGDPIIFEIADTCQQNDVTLPRDDTVQWADGFMLVYSITDRKSFDTVKKLRQHINDTKKMPGYIQQNNYGSGNNNSSSSSQMTPTVPVIIVANKSDLIHLRQVSTEEGEILAKDTDDLFAEVAASEHVIQVAETFYELCRELHSIRRRSKTSILDRVLGGNKGTGRPDTFSKK